ncbi:CHAT domain-containing protein [Corallococcus coralloides]|nr:CHAT domain-containing protein [Corallococcus coralloides]
MRQVLGWMMMVVLCCTTGAAAESQQTDALLREAQTAYDKGKALNSAGSYAEAEARFGHALALREKVLGKTHPQVAECLDLMGHMQRLQGDFARAEPLLQRGLSIREVAFGGSHPLVARSLNSLALLYEDQGMNVQAESFHVRALAIREAAFGKDALVVTQSLNNLANLYQFQGLFDRARPLYERSLAIREAALGKNHLDLAGLIYNLACLYRAEGMYRKAQSFHERALAIREDALGKEHLDVATSLNGLAIVYKAQGLYGRAGPLYKRALAIREASLGKKHPQVADTLNNLGNLYLSQAMTARAEPFYERALAITEAVFSENHPDVAGSRHSLALLRVAQNRLDEAVELFTRAFTASEQRLRQEALGFSERRLDSLLRLLREDEERINTSLREHPDHAGLRRLALGAALLLKGRSVEETAGISRAVYRSLGAQEHETLERLRGLRSRLASLWLEGGESLPPAAHQQQLKELAEQADALEADLARRSAPLRALAALPSPADIVDRVAQALPQDGALVEFIYYRDNSLADNGASRTTGLRYLALVLLPDATTRAIDLGPAGPMDLAASNLRAALARRDADFLPHAQALYRRSFKPLLPLLGKTRRVFLSPDGQLSLVPFAALHDGRQFLVEAFDFTYVTSGKDLLPRAQENAPATSVVVIANPDFIAASASSASATGADSSRTGRSTALERFFSALGKTEHRAWNLSPLPGSGEEAQAIQRLLPQAQLFLGSEATKLRVMQLPTPGILHLATHGFFLEDAAAAANSRGVVQFGALSEDTSAAEAPDPLLRSGLLFAGASAPKPPGSKVSSTPPDNALATALELAGLDLWGTQLVVLSACDTGRGEIKNGQGVYGLRRAFIVAGAETVVTSMWAVQDQATSRLMELYYRNLLAGQGRAVALREAMRAFRQLRPHPHYWAPFIVVGRDAPLRGLNPN